MAEISRQSSIMTPKISVQDMRLQICHYHLPTELLSQKPNLPFYVDQYHPPGVSFREKIF